MSLPLRSAATASPRPFSGFLLVALLLAVTAATSCALLVPSPWRVSTPVPLHGGAVASDPQSGTFRETSTEDLAHRIATDRARLMALAANVDGDVVTERPIDELREIALRLPELQREMARRPADDAGLRARHPTIR